MVILSIHIHNNIVKQIAKIVALKGSGGDDGVTMVKCRSHFLDTVNIFSAVHICKAHYNLVKHSTHFYSKKQICNRSTNLYSTVHICIASISA